MKSLRFALLSTILFPALAGSFAQPAAKPVLSPEPAAVPATPPPAPVSTPGVIPSDYVIGPSDSLQISVNDHPEFSATLPVRPDGKISLPLLNDVRAAGFTPMQLGADLDKRLEKFLKPPIDVEVSVLAVNSKFVFFTGEVMHNGPLAITPGMTMLQAVATAGLTPYANKKKIYILRGDPSKPQKILFDYTKALKKGDMQGVLLLAGDTIVVP